MVDIYIYIQKSTCFYSLMTGTVMHSLRKVATFYRQEGRAWEQGKGCEGCLVEEDCLFRADKLLDPNNRNIVVQRASVSKQ